jgi:hypothetical protein
MIRLLCSNSFLLLITDWDWFSPMHTQAFMVPTRQRGNPVWTRQRPVYSLDAGAWEPDNFFLALYETYYDFCIDT